MVTSYFCENISRLENFGFDNLYSRIINEFILGKQEIQTFKNLKPFKPLKYQNDQIIYFKDLFWSKFGRFGI